MALMAEDTKRINTLKMAAKFPIINYGILEVSSISRQRFSTANSKNQLPSFVSGQPKVH